MASKKKRMPGSEFKREDILQAVVIADTFNVRFGPITAYKPKVLLPLVNIPLIDYTLEFLCAAGIQETVVFTCVHADQVRKHIENSKWSKPGSLMEVTTVGSEGCRSLGDALREIDSQQLISNDFVLVSGDTVANVNLKPIIENHKARRLKEKTPVMTMIFKRAAPGHRTRCPEDDALLAIGKNNDRILYYKRVGATKKFSFPLELFKISSDIQVRYDLLDCHLCVCSPQVLTLFTDEFDYLTRDDFVKGIMDNEEILGNTIHVHVIEDQYAARVSNLQMYDAISKDVIQRWSYPFVPDCNVTGQCDHSYVYNRHNIYLHRDVTLARGCVLQEDVVIGKGTSVGDNSSISHSVIGRNCTIGQNVKIQGAYVWDNVTIDDNCTIDKSMLADNVHIKSVVKVQKYCLLAQDVTVGPDVTLESKTMLIANPIEEDDFGDEEDNKVKPVIDKSIVGSEGVAYIYEPPADSDEEEDLIKELWALHIESESDDDSSVASDLEEYPPGSPPPDETKMFYDEAIGTLERAISDDHNVDNMVLEINSLKHAYGLQIQEVNLIVTKVIMEMPFRKNPSPQPTEYLGQLKSNLKKLLPLLKNYIRSEESQKDCLSSLEELSVVNDIISAILMKVLHMLYDVDILTEDVLLRWHQTIPQGVDFHVERAHIRKKVSPFIDWLREADEESSEEED